MFYSKFATSCIYVDGVEYDLWILGTLAAHSIQINASLLGSQGNGHALCGSSRYAHVSLIVICNSAHAGRE